MIERIIETVHLAFPVVYLNINDTSRHHQDHYERANLDVPSHLQLTLVSAAFERISPLERERAVQTVFAPFWGLGLHALSLTLYSPEEWLTSGLKAQ